VRKDRNDQNVQPSLAAETHVIQIRSNFLSASYRIKIRTEDVLMKEPRVTLLPTPAQNFGKTKHDVSYVRSDKVSFGRNSGLSNIVQLRVLN
jgi:hypothetical protein